MGFLIESPALAEAVADALGRGLGERAYRVHIAADGRMQWVERSAAGERVHDDEPGASLLKRLGLGLLSVLPIEWML
jgi:putative cardiolipin synthase